MTHKFQIGDIIINKNNPEDQCQIVDITGNSEKCIKGPWFDGAKKVLVPPKSYITKDLEKNKLSWDYFNTTHKYYQLFQRTKEKSLKWKNYEEVLV